METKDERAAKQAIQSLKSEIEIHRIESIASVTKLSDKFYDIYWDGSVPHDRFQILALVAAINEELVVAVNALRKYQKALFRMESEVLYLDEKRKEFEKL